MTLGVCGLENNKKKKFKKWIKVTVLLGVAIGDACVPFRKRYVESVI